MDQVFSLQPCRKVKVITIEDDIVAKLQVQPVSAAALVCDQYLFSDTEFFQVFQALFVWDPSRKFCVCYPFRLSLSLRS